MMKYLRLHHRQVKTVLVEKTDRPRGDSATLLLVERGRGTVMMLGG